MPFEKISIGSAPQEGSSAVVTRDGDDVFLKKDEYLIFKSNMEIIHCGNLHH